MNRSIFSKSLVTFLFILALVAIGGAIAFQSRSSIPANNPQLASGTPQANVTPDLRSILGSLPTLESDPGSVNTIVYGFKIPGTSVLSAVNDSGKNHTMIATLPQNVKFIIPLKDGRQVLYIADLDQYDQGGRLEVKTIKPTGTDTDGTTTVIFEAQNKYRIDGLVISEDHNWISWWQTKPEGAVNTHERNYFQSFKANIADILAGRPGLVNAIQLTNEKGADGVTIHLPKVITNTGEVLFDGIKPVGYDLYDGFVREDFKILVPRDRYNGHTYLFNQRYLLYTGYEKNNCPEVVAGNSTSARTEVLNKTVVKVFDLQEQNNPSYKSLTVAPGDACEQYNHPIYISGDPSGELTIATEVFKVKSDGKLWQSEIQLVKKHSDGTFEKRTVVAVPDGGATYRILTVGELPNGNKTLIIGSNSGDLGNMGSGYYLATSGYQSMLSFVRVYNLETGALVSEIKPKGVAIGEFLGVLPKTAAQTIGIDRNESLLTLLPSADEMRQLKLATFTPVEPKRKRTNFRSECEEEWEKKGYQNQEACESCPVYVYSDTVQPITIRPKTRVYAPSALPQLVDGGWNFTADRSGRLVMADGTSYPYLDFLFPRGGIQAPPQGVILAQNEYAPGLHDFALRLGLNEREAADVVAYFSPQIDASPYIFLSQLSQEETEKLLDFEVSPKPDSYATRIIYVKKLSQRPAYHPQTPEFTPIPRGSLTVVSWGGIVE